LLQLAAHVELRPVLLLAAAAPTSTMVIYTAAAAAHVIKAQKLIYHIFLLLSFLVLIIKILFQISKSSSKTSAFIRTTVRVLSIYLKLNLV
jgi:hypothetical protein